VSGYLIVGIDPGVTTGFALWDKTTGRLEEVNSMGIVAAMLRVQLMHTEGVLHSLVYEDARLRTGYFGERAKHNQQGAGSIKRDCSVWAEWLGMLGCAYKAVSPRAKGPKLNAEQFAKLTGWQGRTNEHGRDAALLLLKMRS
jgi:hypothetical protein